MFKNVSKKIALQEHQFISAEKYKDWSDQEIIKKILSGSTSLFEVLMRRYNQRLFRLQRSYISDEDAVKDTLQLTYLKAYKNLNSFRGDAKFSTWISRIAINEALKYINKQKRYSNLHLVDNDPPMNRYTINADNTPEDKIIQKDLKKLLEHVVNTLPPKYRSVYLMREVEKMSTKETAKCLDISISNVKVRLHRAKQKVQDKLTRKVADAEIFNFLGERCDRLVFSVMRRIENKN
jgi:RNA polymerase sigma-70 factor (ECF subfamily)